LRLLRALRWMKIRLNGL